METTVTREPDQTIQLKITIPYKDVEKVREEVIIDLAKNIELPGFRKGKAPPEVAAGKISKEKLNEELLKRVLTDAYNKAITQEKIHPIISPRIHIDAFEDGTDLTFTAETCEEPPVDLKNYKEEVKTVTAKSKIIIPGKEEKSEDEKKVHMDEILTAALKSVQVTIPHILIEQEANRLLSQMLDELKSLGLTLDQYIASRDKTSEQLRAEYEQKAEQDLKLEFMLRKIADVEKITVDQKDIDAVLSTITDQKQKEQLVKNPYFLASIIRQQKTLDFLSKI